MASLTEFPLFTQLPLDIRFLIWHLLMPVDRVVLLQERVSIPTTDFTDTIYVNDSEQSQENRALATELGFFPISLQTYRGQTQLENFGFTSSEPAPSLPTEEEIRELEKRQWEQLRKGQFYTSDPIPILVHICQETRALAQAYGYALTFSTRTAPAMTWFNYRKDILFLDTFFVEAYREYSYPDRPGSGGLSQLQVTDLEKVERLAMPTDVCGYYSGGLHALVDGKVTPSHLQDAARYFSAVKELCVVLAYNFEDDHHFSPHPQPKGDQTYNYSPDAKGGKGDRTVLDMAIEEYFGHYIGWEPESNPQYSHPQFWREDRKTPKTAENLTRATEEILKQYPSHPPPTPRLVTILPQSRAEKAPESRLRFRQFIHKLFRDRVEEEQTDQESAFRFLFDYGYPWYGVSPTLRSINLDWVTEAANALSLTGEEPFLFTDEWVENHLKRKKLNEYYQESYQPVYWD